MEPLKEQLRLDALRRDEILDTFPEESLSV